MIQINARAKRLRDGEPSHFEAYAMPDNFFPVVALVGAFFGSFAVVLLASTLFDWRAGRRSTLPAE